MFAWWRAFWSGRKSRDGAWGESIAAEHLRKKPGWRIVAHNWRSPRDRRDELDLVAADGDALVFVEVKTRSAGALVPGYYAVNARKKRVVLRAARAYLAGLARRPRTVRFDIVEVARDETGDPVVRHFENVPLFPKRFFPID